MVIEEDSARKERHRLEFLMGQTSCQAEMWEYIIRR